MKAAEWSEESFDRMIAVNLKSVWLCMKYEILQMQAQGGGAIVKYQFDPWSRRPAEWDWLRGCKARGHWPDQDRCAGVR